MKSDTLNRMIRGWVAGSFEPSLVKTDDYELAVKYYKRNDKEASHAHFLSSEITIIAMGSVIINGVQYYERDIIIQERGDYADFECISEEAITVVLRPDGSFPNDKHFK
jgi:hypothetical protein